MDLATVKNIMVNWHRNVGHKIKYCPPEAKFISNDPETDAQLYHFQVDSGLEITLNENNTAVKEWRIVDNEKFMMFVLRYS